MLNDEDRGADAGGGSRSTALNAFRPPAEVPMTMTSCPIKQPPVRRSEGTSRTISADTPVRSGIRQRWQAQIAVQYLPLPFPD
jgi:hypothetical protein